MGNESKKKHILEKFFNFSKAFILHAKIPHSTHTLAPRKISFSSFPYIPYSPPLISIGAKCRRENQNYFVVKEKSSHTSQNSSPLSQENTKLEMGNPATERKM